MEDLYVNVNFPSTLVGKSIVLFMSFSELEFKWSFMLLVH